LIRFFVARLTTFLLFLPPLLLPFLALPARVRARWRVEGVMVLVAARQRAVAQHRMMQAAQMTSWRKQYNNSQFLRRRQYSNNHRHQLRQWVWIAPAIQ
jgi:hypothetical protein